MYLFLRRVSKLSARRDDSRFFSTLPLSPYFRLSDSFFGQSSEGYVVSHRYFDPKTAKKECISERTVPNAPQFLLGASKGWVVGLQDEDNKVSISDLYKPWVSSPSVISLPSIGSVMLHHLGSVYFYLWTHVESQHLPASSITYSKRDKVFYFTSPNGIFLGVLDLIHREIKYYRVRLRNTPKLSPARWRYLNRECMLTKHLVESPSGQLYFIMWEDEKREVFNYTEDIGDLCIFLGKSEAFSVSASLYPGLIPNSIYYCRGPGLGRYDIASAKPRALSSLDGNYWIEPVA
ncbi:unnamed protein product [Microthlaspi erraticum]|uniref:KIB1-4 beta-propeller domain-containing protein n=1 Tax=Microthlaspi erraticum TaxID=1685480 RepID=A0A6D2JQ95_9BRAS|nr:unnamed protein product [Microthlaspi erraticum]